MAMESCKYFNINIEVDGKKTQPLLVTNDTLLKNIRNKLGDDIELIYNGNILDDNVTIAEIGLDETHNIIYAFNIVDTKSTDLLNIFQNILQSYTQSGDIPLNHYNNIFASMMNLQSPPINSNLNSNVNNTYSNELDTLASLGFENRAENLILLQLYNGNVDYVADLLLSE